MKFQIFTVSAVAFMFLSLSACQQKQKTVSELKTEVLNKAGQCSVKIKETYEKQIETQRKLLKSDDKLKKSMQNMLKVIKCK